MAGDLEHRYLHEAQLACRRMGWSASYAANVAECMKFAMEKAGRKHAVALASADAEGYRRGVEDAAKVADRCGSVPAAGGDGCGTRILQSVDGAQIAVAIRSLTAPDKEGA